MFLAARMGLRYGSCVLISDSRGGLRVNRHEEVNRGNSYSIDQIFLLSLLSYDDRYLL